MNYRYGLLPESWLWIAMAIYLLVLVVAIFTTRWRIYIEQPEKSHVLLGSSVSLIILWQITATALPGLEYHYLGATLLTLMFGWQRALIVISLVLLGLLFNGSSDWQTYPLNVLTMGVVPIMVSYSIFRFTDSRLPNHFFVYIFINAFFGAAFAILCAVLTTSALLILGGVYTFAQLSYDYFPFLPLMMFPEAFITGMLMTIMVVMQPDWVSTFDDDRYLKNK